MDYSVQLDRLWQKLDTMVRQQNRTNEHLEKISMEVSAVLYRDAGAGPVVSEPCPSCGRPLEKFGPLPDASQHTADNPEPMTWGPATVG